MMTTAAPTDLIITPRDQRFGRNIALNRWWMGGDAVKTVIFNALSVTFPRGEAFFIDSVRNHRADADPRLAADIQAFTKQEVVHSREHLAFNRRVTEAGYDTSRLEKKVEDRLAYIATKPPIASLAVTMALEHFTAILAHALLANPRYLKGADKESGDLWRWHAIEEIEHKGVAFDTWRLATRNWPRRKRWMVKSAVMLAVTRNFLVDRTGGILDLLQQDGRSGPRVWARLAWLTLGYPGILRAIALPWASYFLPGFHPWRHDDRVLIADTERQLARGSRHSPPDLAA
jgi:predicted metal-dependent hydrolase